MLPLLPFRATTPTSAPLPAEQLTIRLTFMAPNSVELTQNTNFDVSSAPDGTQRAIAALVQWVRQPFPWPDRTAWTQTHAEFSRSVKQLACRKLNTAGTYEETTPYSLQTFHQHQIDDNGTQYVEFVFALDLGRVWNFFGSD